MQYIKIPHAISPPAAKEIFEVGIEFCILGGKLEL
jgi:hypothetical protein